MITSKVAKRYAKALLSIGQEDGDFRRYGKELREFCGLYQGHAEFRQVITNPVFAVEDRKKVLQAIFTKNAYAEKIKAFLSLLLDKNRIHFIQEITAYYENLTDELMNIAHVLVRTPRPLKEETAKRLEKALEEMTSKKIRMEIKQEMGLIGGIAVKIGDLVLDGSIQAQLRGLEESLKRGGYR